MENDNEIERFIQPWNCPTLLSRNDRFGSLFSNHKTKNNILRSTILIENHKETQL